MAQLTDITKVISVGPDVIEVEITDTIQYEQLDDKLQIGSYIQISDDLDASSQLIAVVKSFKVRDRLASVATGTEVTIPQFVISLQPVGRLEDGNFRRGGQQITIPPKFVEIATGNILKKIYGSIPAENSFSFGNLAQDERVPINIDGDRFFGKHIGVVGSTGSGKSSTVAAILQEGIKRNAKQLREGILNNSHVIIFDLHGEYHSAFPEARVLGVNELVLPYWLMNSEELEEMFIESNEQNSHNQVSQFRDAVIKNKIRNNSHILPSKISYDDPIYFSLEEVINYLTNLNAEMIGKAENEGLPKLIDGTLVKLRHEHYFDKVVQFVPQSNGKADKATSGPFHGDFDRFLMRLGARRNDKRLDFLLDPKNSKGNPFTSEDLTTILSNLIGYSDKNTNVTILDLSGIPFEVLSVVVSLVTRLVFTFSFSFKKLNFSPDAELPFLLVLEEAHNYIAKSEGAKFNSVRKAVERVAKEGRKYGVSLMIVSQRPSEISETVFSQCNNFVAMRLTNPTDQNYVKRLLPDDVSSLTESIASLEQREALIIGDAVALPSLIKVNKIEHLPSSMDVPFYSEWKKDWYADVIAEVVKGMGNEQL